MAVSTGIITTVVGSDIAGHIGDGGDATTASLRLPNGITVDAEGNTSLNRFPFCFTTLLFLQATCMSQILGTNASVRLQYPLYLRILRQISQHNPHHNRVDNQVHNLHRNQVDNPLLNQVDNQLDNRHLNLVHNHHLNRVDNQLDNRHLNQVHNHHLNRVDNRVDNPHHNQVHNHHRILVNNSHY